MWFCLSFCGKVHSYLKLCIVRSLLSKSTEEYSKILSFVAMHRFKYEWTLVSAMELYFLFKSWSAYSAGEKLRSQCPRTDLNKRSLPRPKTTTAWKLIPGVIPHRIEILHIEALHWVHSNSFYLVKKFPPCRILILTDIRPMGYKLSCCDSLCSR